MPKKSLPRLEPSLQSWKKRTKKGPSSLWYHNRKKGKKVLVKFLSTPRYALFLKSTIFDQLNLFTKVE